jgi:Spondin_N
VQRSALPELLEEHPMLNFSRLTGAAAALAMIMSPQPGLAQGVAEYEVTVTNITRGQTFTPIAILTHAPSIRLFRLGAPAIPQPETLAEEGDVAPLVTLAQAFPSVVFDVETSGAPPAGFTAPGTAKTLRVQAPIGAQLTLAAMLIPTNDAFVALNGVDLPRGFDPVTFDAIAYDSGTEVNDELCASIPGPNFVECGGPGGGGAPAAGAEGYVHVHAGMHGIGDMDVAQRDWRNPTARVMVRRVR